MFGVFYPWTWCCCTPRAFPDSNNNKRKYDEQSLLSLGRPTDFSTPSAGDTNPNLPPPAATATEDLEIAKQRPKTESNGNSGFDNNNNDGYVQKPPVQSVAPLEYGFQEGSQGSKQIDITNGSVGLIIGKNDEIIDQLQTMTGAKIQVMRDMDADPFSQTRKVDLTGTPDQISGAEQLIKDVLAKCYPLAGGSQYNKQLQTQSGAKIQSETGGSGPQSYITKIPNNKVGLVNETIENMQARCNARIQVIPLHLTPDCLATERILEIDGTYEQIRIAKQLVNEVINENRVRNPSMGGQYSQQGYQARPPTSWAPPDPPMQQASYGFMQQPGAYPGQYNTPQLQYPGYPPQPSAGGYSAGWDQTTGAPNQWSSQSGTGYDNSGYGYSQQPASDYNQQAQGYSQEDYGYGLPQTNPTQGYDQQQGYGSTPGYGPTPTPTATNGNPPFMEALKGTPPIKLRHRPSRFLPGNRGMVPMLHRRFMVCPHLKLGMGPNQSKLLGMPHRVTVLLSQLLLSMVNLLMVHHRLNLVMEHQLTVHHRLLSKAMASNPLHSITTIMVGNGVILYHM